MWVFWVLLPCFGVWKTDPFKETSLIFSIPGWYISSGTFHPLHHILLCISKIVCISKPEKVIHFLLLVSLDVEGTGVSKGKYDSSLCCFGGLLPICKSLFLSIGKIPVVLKPAIIFVIVMLFIQDFEKRVEKLYSVTNFPGFWTI